MNVHEPEVAAHERRESKFWYRSHRMCGLVGEGDGVAGDERELRDLHADLLARVFSFLPQNNLFDIMLVNRRWEKAVREGDVLWNKIKVFQKLRLPPRPTFCWWQA